MLHRLPTVCRFLLTSFSHIFLLQSIAEKGYSNYPGAPPVGMVPPMYVGAPVFVPSEYPMQCTCPNCRQTIVTRTVKENGLLTWLCIGGLVLIGCWFGCCLIPLCVDACKVIRIRSLIDEDFVFHRIRFIIAQVVRYLWVWKKSYDQLNNVANTRLFFSNSIVQILFILSSNMARKKNKCRSHCAKTQLKNLPRNKIIFVLCMLNCWWPRKNSFSCIASTFEKNDDFLMFFSNLINKVEQIRSKWKKKSLMSIQKESCLVRYLSTTFFFPLKIQINRWNICSSIFFLWLLIKQNKVLLFVSLALQMLVKFPWLHWSIGEDFTNVFRNANIVRWNN